MALLSERDVIFIMTTMTKSLLELQGKCEPEILKSIECLSGLLSALSQQLNDRVNWLMDERWMMITTQIHRIFAIVEALRTRLNHLAFERQHLLQPEIELPLVEADL
jgi:hypothetical protein